MKLVIDLKANHNQCLSLAVTEVQRSKKGLVIKNIFICYFAVDLETHILYFLVRGIFNT